MRSRTCLLPGLTSIRQTMDDRIRARVGRRPTRSDAGKGTDMLDHHEVKLQQTPEVMHPAKFGCCKGVAKRAATGAALPAAIPFIDIPPHCRPPGVIAPEGAGFGVGASNSFGIAANDRWFGDDPSAIEARRLPHLLVRHAVLVRRGIQAAGFGFLPASMRGMHGALIPASP